MKSQKYYDSCQTAYKFMLYWLTVMQAFSLGAPSNHCMCISSNNMALQGRTTQHIEELLERSQEGSLIAASRAHRDGGGFV